MEMHLETLESSAVPPPHADDAPRLPDVLRDNLDVVFVGTAAGRRSAELGVYYAHSGNYSGARCGRSG